MRHLYIHSPVILASGQVNDTFNALTDYPTAEVPVKNVVGDFDIGSAVTAGHTVIFGSAPGLDDLGRQRIRRVFANTELLIGYSPKGKLDGEIDIYPNAYFAILNDYRVWAKTPRFIYDELATPVTREYKDYDMLFESHGSGVLLYPKANAGPAHAGPVDPITGLLSVPMSGGDSYSLSSSIASYLWDVADGTIISGTATSVSITATFPPGFRYVSLKVTDAAGLQHTMVVPVYARDPANDTTVPVWQIETLQRTAQGTQFSVRILSDLPRSTMPDGTLVLMWDDADPNVRCEFAGWHHSDTASLAFVRTGALRDTVLDCLDIAALLEKLPGRSQVLQHAEVPANWSEMQTPSMYKLIDYLLRWGSTGLELADLHWPSAFALLSSMTWPTDFDDLVFVVRETGASTLMRQVSEQARAMVPDHMLQCTRQGELMVVVDPILQPLADRPDTVQANLTGQVASISVQHMPAPRVHWIRGAAMLAGSTMLTDNIEVDYTLVTTGSYPAGVTSLAMEPLPVAIPNGSVIYLVGQVAPFATTTAAAIAGDIVLSVTATSTLINPTYDLKYTQTETGPPYIPTVFCIAPGRVPGQGEQNITINNKIAANQAALNDAIGHLYARLNAEYGVVDIELKGQSDLAIDPALPEWIAIGSFAARFVPQRALPIYGQADDYLFLPLEVIERWRYSKQGPRVTITVRAIKETFGGPASTITGSEL